MEKNQILTKEQKIILDEVSQNDFLQKNFYFSDMPRMIKPLSLEELKAFFREKAKQLGKMAIE